MRIVAGEFRGRKLKVPPGETRPTTDRVREAWFNILGSDLNGATMLDLFAGSGALGLEGLSRGARRVEFVETGRRALHTIRENIRTLGVSDRTIVHHQDAIGFVAAGRPGRGEEGEGGEEGGAGVFDIAVADPPYDSDHALRLVELFRETPFALMLCVEHRAQLELDGDDTRRYGDIAITFCHRE